MTLESSKDPDAISSFNCFEALYGHGCVPSAAVGCGSGRPARDTVRVRRAKGWSNEPCGPSTRAGRGRYRVDVTWTRWRHLDQLDQGQMVAGCESLGSRSFRLVRRVSAWMAEGDTRLLRGCQAVCVLVRTAVDHPRGLGHVPAVISPRLPPSYARRAAGRAALAELHWQSCTGRAALAELHWQSCTDGAVLTELH